VAPFDRKHWHGLTDIASWTKNVTYPLIAHALGYGFIAGNRNGLFLKINKRHEIESSI
jgi:hypothetical protein